LFVLAIEEITFAAGRTSMVMAAVPTDTDAVALLPSGYAAAKVINQTGNFVAWNAGILQAGPVAFLYDVVAHADSAGLDLHANLAWAGRRYLAFDNFKIAPGRCHLNCLPLC